MSKDENGRPVTLRELNDKLSAFRWEFRFLIVAAVVGGKFIPPSPAYSVGAHAARVIAALFH